MSIEEFELFLFDLYQMDVWFPPFFKWKTEFKKASHSIWAVNELRRYIINRLYPRKSGTMDEFVKITGDFINKARSYSKIKPETALLFSIAQNVATDVLEVLYAMK